MSIIEISQVQNCFWTFLWFVHFGFVRYKRKWQYCKLSMDWKSTCLLEGIWLRISLVIWGPIILSIICHENELMGPKNRNSCLKITQNVAFEFLAFSTNFCPIKSDLSGNTGFKGFQKLAKLDYFLAFLTNFCQLKM